jgi:hypothetical protein
MTTATMYMASQAPFGTSQAQNTFDIPSDLMDYTDSQFNPDLPKTAGVDEPAGSELSVKKHAACDECRS